jgi:hypothetical protein
MRPSSSPPNPGPRAARPSALQRSPKTLFLRLLCHFFCRSCEGEDEPGPVGNPMSHYIPLLEWFRRWVQPSTIACLQPATQRQPTPLRSLNVAGVDTGTEPVTASETPAGIRLPLDDAGRIARQR